MDILKMIEQSIVNDGTGLNLDEYDLTSIPEEVFELKKLRVLRLNGNKIASIPEEITKLTNLSELHLDNNRLTEVPQEILKMSTLTKLNLSFNQISEIPKEITGLSNLIVLNLDGNRIANVPDEFIKLYNLEELHMEKNLLTQIPEQIANLTSLKRLYLTGNKITNIDGKFAKLTNLAKLYLGYNQITNIPQEFSSLINLEELYLIQNKISEIPIETILLPNLKVLEIIGNPINNLPIELINYGVNVLRNYFESLAESGVQKLYEAKLIVVGEGGVGKTSLTKKLIDSNCGINLNEPTTEGINIKDWRWDCSQCDEDTQFKVNIWDFGGQEIYHATHQFFLTARSMYIFVWDARQEDKYTSFEYWLNIISLLSNNSPVVIVLNKIDERIKAIDQVALKEKFPNIVGFHKVSCLEGEGIDTLINSIKNNILKLSHIGNDWPLVWTKIRKDLENDSRDYIDYTEYIEICKKHKLSEEKAKYLSAYLHDLGVILHFSDDSILRNIVILKPEWGTNAVYKILDRKEVQNKNGRFSFADLKSIWEGCKYPDKKHAELLQLMMKFELCFKLGNSNEYIVPELLSPERPEFKWDNKDNLKFEYRYEFMPSGIITRFIVRNHNIIEGKIYWRNGVVLSYANTRALVMSEPLSRKIKVAVEGANKKELLALIRKQFEYIHKTLNNPNLKEMMPCTCDKCRNGDSGFYEYRVLKEFYLNNIKQIHCEKSYKQVSIGELLNAIGDNERVVKNNTFMNLFESLFKK